MKNLLTTILIMANTMIYSQIIPSGYEYMEGEYVEEGERQYSEAYGATFGYFEDEEIGRILEEGIVEVYEEAKEVMEAYGYDFNAPDFIDTNIPIEEWGADSEVTKTVILSGNGWLYRAWVMVDIYDDNKTYLASVNITKKEALFRIDEWDPEKD